MAAGFARGCSLEAAAPRYTVHREEAKQELLQLKVVADGEI